jgi:hypothetical protein
MQITSTHLSRGAAGAAAAAGAIFVAVQVGHPASDTFTTETSEWVVRSTAKTVMAALALAGITGLYLRQHRQAGLLGLAGYLVFTVGYLGLLGVEVIAATVLPTLVDTQPGLVDDVVTAAVGGTPAGDIGGVQVLLNVSGIGYILGGLLFGVAIFRARVLPRWMGALLAASTVATAALAVLPESFNRPLAVPEGIALIALGVALWRNPVDAGPTSAWTHAMPAAVVGSGPTSR